MQLRREIWAGPHGLAWLIAWSFMVGASLFALGSFPPYSQRVDPGVVGSTFVIGSVFFTAAAYGQFVQVLGERPGGVTGWRRYLGWRPGVTAWWAVAVQLAGTVFFNISTVNATAEGLSAEEANRLVWAPDIFGSVAFLVASHLAWIGACGGWWRVRRERDDWWISAINYVGSIFFMVSAIASLTLTTTDQVLNTALVNLATFVGAACFLVGAYLLLPTGSVDPDEPGPT